MRAEADTVVEYEKVVAMENGQPNLMWLWDPMMFFGGDPEAPVGLHYVACLSSEGDSDDAGLLGQLMADVEAESKGERPEYRIAMEKLFGVFVAEMEDKHPEYQIMTEEFENVVYYPKEEGAKGRLVKLVHRDPACAGSPFYVFIEFNMFGTGIRPHAVMHIYQTAQATTEGIGNGTCRGEDSLRIGEGDSELTVGVVGGTLLHPSIKDNQGGSVGAKVPSFYANHVLDDALPYCDVRSEFFESVDFSPQSEYEPAQPIFQAVPPQSSYNPQPQQVSQPQTDTMSVQTVKAGKGLSVGGIIAGIFIPLVGLILGIIGMVQNKRAGGKGTLGKVAIAVSVIAWLISWYVRTALM